MKNKLKAIGFDLDGTLVDSLRISATWMSQAASRASGKPVSEETIRQHFGKPEPQMLVDILGNDLAKDALAIYQQILSSEVHKMRVFPGVQEVLATLTEMQIPAAIYTTRSRWTTEEILKQKKIFSSFAYIVAGDEVQKLKPDPEGVARLCEYFKTTSSEFAFIGDSESDVLAGQSAGARSYQALWSEGVTRIGHSHVHSVEDMGRMIRQGEF